MIKTIASAPRFTFFNLNLRINELAALKRRYKKDGRREGRRVKCLERKRTRRNLRSRANADKPIFFIIRLHFVKIRPPTQFPIRQRICKLRMKDNLSIGAIAEIVNKLKSVVHGIPKVYNDYEQESLQVGQE